MADTLYHALVLNLHQPHGNLEHLLAHNEWEAREVRLQWTGFLGRWRTIRTLAGCIWRYPEPY